ncbi:Stress-response A/B barrel domain-containing protein HS1 [Pseudocercospora fuligena]|uniref:Stress-response A/B barrel domain-containing protein HS1 n=1 Tax=Pseudocercospora fuligena TaxID=685502 RepID=A0A8H6R610_9PEZI|nr:Stress-response A/B barrel domain-containing protein HS1 [Pseudocercospora fuligena]
MPIIHIVLFEFSPTTTHAQVEDVCTRMLSLSQKCLHPTSNKPYVKSYGGGRDTSPEGLQGGFSHGFVSEFQSEEDREYYLKKDPVHLEFVKSLEGIVLNVRVVDFEPGKF